MPKLDHSAGYYQKMEELQEKLKKSEEERLKLEEKFILMMKTCREEEEKRIHALRERYEKFLEDDKRRRDRNERILQTLDKIESRATALSAKSERLKLLRKHYEAYLLRMYPLWKKQPVTTAEQPSPFRLSVDNGKSLPWFGSSSNLYTNNLPQVNAQSPLSPGSDQLWLPPNLNKSAMYSKIPIMNNILENQNSIVEACSPAVENALDNYLQRAANLLRVPVEELVGTSEKHDEEKSVHTEQDTSRDLLNVSLSDDSILQEKKAENVAQFSVPDLKKESVGKIMIKEEKHVSILPDFQAGGDNLLTDRQTVQQSSKNYPPDSTNLQHTLNAGDNSMQNEIPKRSEPEHVNLEEINKKSDTVSVLHHTHPNDSVLHVDYALNETCQEIVEVPFENEFQTIVQEDKKEGGLALNRENIEEQYVNVYQEEHVNNSNNSLEHNFDENVNRPISDILSGNPETSEILQEPIENMNNLSYAVEQEQNDNLEYTKTIAPDEIDLSQNFNNVSDEFVENLEPITQSFGAMEEKGEPWGVTEKSNEGNDPCNLENYYENPRSGEEQEYVLQNAGNSEQYIQGQYVGDNLVQQSEQYIHDNTEQYVQEQYIGDGVHYEQYPEQYSNEQYVENGTEFAHYQPVKNAEEYTEDQYAVDKNDNDETHTYLDQQQGDHNEEIVNQHGVPEETVKQQLHREIVDESSVQFEMGVEENPCSVQPQAQIPAEDLLDTGHFTGGNVQSEDIVEEEHVQSHPELTDTNGQKILENQLREVSNVEHQEEYMQEGHIDKVASTGQESSAEQVQQNKEEVLTVQSTAAPVTNSINTSAIEEDSEESSVGFWNPPHHSTIPSVDELAPKAPVLNEDTSESSADSKMDIAANKPPIQNVQQFRSLLGVPPDAAGDSSVLSDQDEVEDQLAALVADPLPSGSAAATSKPEPKPPKEVEMRSTDQNANGGNIVASNKPAAKSEKETRSNKTSAECAQPPVRTGLKKPPALIKVLESDTESLNLETGANSNVDSDEFDFSTE